MSSETAVKEESETNQFAIIFLAILCALLIGGVYFKYVGSVL